MPGDGLCLDVGETLIDETRVWSTWADLLGVPVVRPRILETTALGAAYLAGLTTALWSSREQIAGQWQAEQRFEPHMEAARREELMVRWREAVGRAKKWEAS